MYRYPLRPSRPAAGRHDHPGREGFGRALSWELEYVFGALDSKKAAWGPEDRKASEEIAAYFANFIENGNPNGAGLPKWPAFGKTHEVMLTWMRTATRLPKNIGIATNSWIASTQAPRRSRAARCEFTACLRARLRTGPRPSGSGLSVRERDGRARADSADRRGTGGCVETPRAAGLALRILRHPLPGET